MSFNVISIIEDSLKVILIKHIRKLRKSNDVLGSAMLVITILTVLVTSEFKDKGLNATTWNYIFIGLFIVSLIYFFFVLYNFITTLDSLDKIMEDISKAKGGALTGMTFPTPIKNPSKSKRKKKK